MTIFFFRCPQGVIADRQPQFPGLGLGQSAPDVFQDDLADRFLEAKLLGHLAGADLAMLHAVGPGLAEIVIDGAAGEQVFVHRNFYPAGYFQSLARDLQAVWTASVGQPALTRAAVSFINRSSATWRKNSVTASSPQVLLT